MGGETETTNGDTDRSPVLDIEDHGTSAEHYYRLCCQIEGCNRTPEFRMRGYIHFSFDGTTYSKDEMSLCKAHKTVIKRSVGTEAEQ